jgi:hypothetical protein
MRSPDDLSKLISHCREISLQLYRLAKQEPGDEAADDPIQIMEYLTETRVIKPEAQEAAVELFNLMGTYMAGQPIALEEIQDAVVCVPALVLYFESCDPPLEFQIVAGNPAAPKEDNPRARKVLRVVNQS